MGLFSRKKKVQKIDFDKTGKRPVIRASICTGEQVAGFKDIKTGRFEDLMVIRSEEDRRLFMELYDVKEEELKKEY
ncbi:MAG: aspartate dehydrogenase [Lachnospiraceae bacterium]|nr:aspartate dehydrogenase [Lachnospiraceae bacterium]MDY4970062.1 aspartate dehydrogenase [Lachnospiraceae bacterium]